MRITAACLLQACVVEPGEGISSSQVEALLTGVGSGIVWAARCRHHREAGREGWETSFWRQAVAAGEGQEGLGADPGGGRMRPGVCCAMREGGLLCHLERRILPDRVWHERTKTGLHFLTSVTFEGGEALMKT